MKTVQVQLIIGTTLVPLEKKQFSGSVVVFEQKNKNKGSFLLK